MSEAPDLTGLAGKPLGHCIAGYMKMTGPGYMQSAMTLGGGSIASCAALGSMFGYKYLWVQIVAMVFGYFVLANVAKQTTNNGERTYKVFWRELHPAMAILWGGSALIATIMWHIPQYSLTVNGLIVLADGLSIDLDNTASTLAMPLMPITVLCFLILLNKKSYMGDAMPTGAMRVFWNTTLIAAVIFMTGAAKFALQANWGKLQNLL